MQVIGVSNLEEVITTLVPRCFCGRSDVSDRTPDDNLTFIEFNTCSEICNRSRTNCNHTCQRRCHAGACLPCPVLVSLAKSKQEPFVEKCVCGMQTREHRFVPCSRFTELKMIAERAIENDDLSSSVCWRRNLPSPLVTMRCESCPPPFTSRKRDHALIQQVLHAAPPFEESTPRRPTASDFPALSSASASSSSLAPPAEPKPKPVSVWTARLKA